MLEGVVMLLHAFLAEPLVLSPETICSLYLYIVSLQGSDGV
jgi:hypothetical protein